MSQVKKEIVFPTLDNIGDKQILCSFSAGRSSGYMAYLMKQKYGDRVKFIFCDTSGEHPNTYEFLRHM